MRKFFLFGAGLNCWGVIKYFGKDNILAVVDNDPRKANRDIGGIPIIMFDEFVNSYKEHIDATIIITAFIRSDEIKRQLENESIYNYYVSPSIQYGFLSIEEISKLIISSQSKSVVLCGTNLISELVIEKLKDYRCLQMIKGIIDTNKKSLLNGEFRDIDVLELQQVKDGDLIVVLESKYESNIRKDLMGLKKTFLDIFEISERQASERCVYMKKYYNRHKGKRCFLVGNGPSLRISDLQLLHDNNEISFGCNKIFLAYNQTKWRPTYFVVADYNIYINSYDKIKAISNENMFIREFYNTEGFPLFEDVNIYHACVEKYYPNMPRFTDDISREVCSGRTVMYDMLQIAAYMGFSEIYLLGNDFNYSDSPEGRGNHFCDDYYLKDNKLPSMFYKEEMALAYERAEIFSREKGFRIFNATRGGKLEAFERVDFDLLFSK